MPLALIVFTTVLAHAAFNASRLTISLNALALGASALTVGVLMWLFAALPMALGVASGRLVDRVGVRVPVLGAGIMIDTVGHRMTFVVPIYGTSIGLTASTIGLVLGSFALATFLIRLALPWISRHVREWPMITTTMAVACVAYLLFPLVRTVPLLAAIGFLLGLGLGATQPSIMSLIYTRAPAGRAGEAVGVRAVVLNVSHTLLPLAFGGMGAALGLLPVFWAMAGALAAGGVFANRRRLAEREA